MTIWRQWVNLPREDRFVGGDVESIEHLGPFRYTVQLQGDGALAGEVEVRPTQERVRYTAQELSRNPRFRAEVSFPHFGGQGTTSFQQQNVYLPPAGGNRYRLRARANGRQIDSDEELEVWRKLYYEVYLTRGVQVPSLAHMEQIYRDRFLVLERVGEDIELAERPVANADAIREIVSSFPTDTPRRRLDPYAFSILFVEMWCRIEHLDVTLSTQSDRVNVQTAGAVTTAEVTMRRGEFGWRGLDEEDDRANGGRGIWLVPGSCVVVDDQGGEHPVPDAQLELIQQSRTIEERRRVGNEAVEPDRVRITLPPSVGAGVAGSTAAGAQPYQLTFAMNIIANLGGTSFSNPNLVVIGTWSWFDRFPDEAYRVVTVHEVGHKLDITTGRTPLTLDAGPHYYEGQGHRGPHCARGMSYVANRARPWQGRPACVMFGAARYHDGNDMVYNPSDDFCVTCRRAVQKQDLDVRFLPAFFSVGDGT